MKRTFRLLVNGEAYEVTVPPHRLLVEVLRDELRLTGTKLSCDVGECGACTVLVEGRPIRGCLTLAIDVHDRPLTTIEGLARDGALHPVQQAFVACGAIQCGFCTPGMVLVAAALLEANPRPTEEEIREALVGNLCRCTGYMKIVEAVQEAAVLLRGER